MALFPFLAIIAFFELAAYYRLFAVPLHSRLGLQDLTSLFIPLISAKRGYNIIGFYHVPIAPLLIGLLMLIKARRFNVIFILILAFVLSFVNSFSNTATVMFYSIVSLCAAVLIAEGFCGLSYAAVADTKWVLISIAAMGFFAIVTLMLATKYFQFFGLADDYARLLIESAKMYILGAVAAGIILFMARAKLRVLWIRRLVLGLAVAIDVFYGARFIVDSIL